MSRTETLLVVLPRPSLSLVEDRGWGRFFINPVLRASLSRSL